MVDEFGMLFFDGGSNFVNNSNGIMFYYMDNEVFILLLY